MLDLRQGRTGTVDYDPSGRLAGARSSWDGRWRWARCSQGDVDMSRQAARAARKRHEETGPLVELWIFWMGAMDLRATNGAATDGAGSGRQHPGYAH